MFQNAKNGSVKMGDTEMEYISFGRGPKNLVMIPGLGDAFKSVKGSAIPFAITYREFTKAYKVYVFSRKHQITEGYSTRDMAKDQVEAMKILGISTASILGVSQGGMIAQYIAIDYPLMVEKLVLAVTISRPNKIVQSVISNWIGMAEAKDYKGIIMDTTEKSYSEKSLKKYRPFYPILGRVGKPKDFSRFIIQATACMNHNAYAELNRINCPTLVIGGDSDQVVGNNSSEEIAERITGSKLFIYHGLGHATYEEAKDFNQRVLEFLSSDK
jgi:pimeloyl-ACP methyl ester carboxylesterase